VFVDVMGSNFIAACKPSDSRKRRQPCPDDLSLDFGALISLVVVSAQAAGEPSAAPVLWCMVGISRREDGTWTRSEPLKTIA
jgi:hypothetical protein